MRATKYIIILFFTSLISAAALALSCPSDNPMDSDNSTKPHYYHSRLNWDGIAPKDWIFIGSSSKAAPGLYEFFYADIKSNYYITCHYTPKDNSDAQLLTLIMYGDFQGTKNSAWHNDSYDENSCGAGAGIYASVEDCIFQNA